ncbi:MAG: hypothetical protein HY298_24065 [Verrucomicrobia bacterium]|nr:hypothetical protein [Verrucomicrobiota bacterium]
MKNKLNYLFLLLAAGFVLATVGCKKEEEAPKAPEMPTNAPAAPAK